MVPMRACMVARLEFINGALSGYRTMFDSSAGSFCSVLDRLACFGRGFLYCFLSFVDWTLIFGSQCEAYASRKNDD
jgi:hypothetical protein